MSPIPVPLALVDPNEAGRMALINSTPLRFSQLKRMGQSPAHYAAGVEPSSGSIDIGNAADNLILGGVPVICYPGATRRGKEWEKWRDDQDPSALIVTRTQLASAEGMARSVQKHRDALRLLDGIVRETQFWTLQGRSCRGTPDVWAGRRLVDLKTSETSDPRRFPWKVRQFAYHAQLSWYQDGLHLAGLGRPEECYIVAVEQAAPYVVTVFRLTEHILDLGARLCRLWFEQLRTCEASGQFPGYSQSIVDLDLPEYDDGELLEMHSAGVTEEETVDA